MKLWRWFWMLMYALAAMLFIRIASIHIGGTDATAYLVLTAICAVGYLWLAAYRFGGQFD